MSDVIHRKWLNAEASQGKDDLEQNADLMTYRIDIGYHIGKVVVYDDLVGRTGGARKGAGVAGQQRQDSRQPTKFYSVANASDGITSTDNDKRIRKPVWQIVEYLTRFCFQSTLKRHHTVKKIA